MAQKAKPSTSPWYMLHSLLLMQAGMFPGLRMQLAVSFQEKGPLRSKLVSELHLSPREDGFFSSPSRSVMG